MISTGTSVVFREKTFAFRFKNGLPPRSRSTVRVVEGEEYRRRWVPTQWRYQNRWTPFAPMCQVWKTTGAVAATWVNWWRAPNWKVNFFTDDSLNANLNWLRRFEQQDIYLFLLVSNKCGLIESVWMPKKWTTNSNDMKWKCRTVAILKCAC